MGPRLFRRGKPDGDAILDASFLGRSPAGSKESPGPPGGTGGGGRPSLHHAYHRRGALPGSLPLGEPNPYRVFSGLATLACPESSAGF